MTFHPELNEYWANFIDLNIVADGKSLAECIKNCKELCESYIETAKEYGVEILRPSNDHNIVLDKYQIITYIETEI